MAELSRKYSMATKKAFNRGREKGTLHEEWIETCQSQGHVKCPPLQAGHLTQPPPAAPSKALSRQMPFYGKTNERMCVIEIWGKGAAKNLAGPHRVIGCSPGACGRHGRPRPCERKGPAPSERGPRQSPIVGVSERGPRQSLIVGVSEAWEG